MRRFLVVAAIAALFAMPVSVAAADPGMSIDVGSPHLVARVVVNVDVSIICQPKPASEGSLHSYWDETYLQVDLRQAVGRRQAVGSSYLYFRGDDWCTGEPQTLVVTVAPDATGPLFKTGVAAMNVSGAADYVVEDWENWENGYSVNQRASTGWYEVRLSR